jgi:hypothetical protein
MTEPERLLSSMQDSSDFERALLRAEVRDPLHTERPARLLLALGLSPGPGGDSGPDGGDPGPEGDARGGDAPAPDAAPSGDAPTLDAGSALGDGGLASATPAAKLGAVVLTGAVFLGAAIVLWPQPPAGSLERAAPLPSAVFVVSGPAQSATAAMPAQEPVPAASAASSSEAPRSPVPGARSATASAVAPRQHPPSVERPSLKDEVAALDHARAALRRGDRPAARSLLNQYFARFPGGILAPEARNLLRQVESE